MKLLKKVKRYFKRGKKRIAIVGVTKHQANLKMFEMTLNEKIIKRTQDCIETDKAIYRSYNGDSNNARGSRNTVIFIQRDLDKKYVDEIWIPTLRPEYFWESKFEYDLYRWGLVKRKDENWWGKNIIYWG